MQILIAGDLVPTDKNKDNFMKKDLLKKLDYKFQNIWKNADYRIFNLECPLGEGMKPMEKNGASLIANSNTVNGIKSLNPNLVLLANNHIMDYGENGLKNTTDLLKKYNISYTGLVNSNKEKFITYYMENNVKIGIYNLCENEFSVATSKKIGANPLNEMKNCKEICSEKDKCDYMIVIFHGGKEFYRYPSPNLQRICRNFIDSGADIVITQHSHCIGCKEEYNNGTIIYGQGNFIFDNGVNDEYWNTSLLISLDIEHEGIKIDYIPIEKSNGLIKISENSKIMEDFYTRTRQIQDNEEFIEEEYNKFSEQHLNNYLNIMNKVRFHKKILNRILNRKFYLKTYNKKDCLKILNIIECEAHIELLIRGLKEKIGMKNSNE